MADSNVVSNIFMRHIYDKDKGFKLIRWFKYRKFLRQIDKATPSFDVLWQIADFIKMLEYVYLYNNTTTRSSVFFNVGFSLYDYVRNTIAFGLIHSKRALGTENGQISTRSKGGVTY